MGPTSHRTMEAAGREGRWSLSCLLWGPWGQGAYEAAGASSPEKPVSCWFQGFSEVCTGTFSGEAAGVVKGGESPREMSCA